MNHKKKAFLWEKKKIEKSSEIVYDNFFFRSLS